MSQMTLLDGQGYLKPSSLVERILTNVGGERERERETASLAGAKDHDWHCVHLLKTTPHPQ